MAQALASVSDQNHGIPIIGPGQIAAFTLDDLRQALKVPPGRQIYGFLFPHLDRQRLQTVAMEAINYWVSTVLFEYLPPWAVVAGTWEDLVASLCDECEVQSIARVAVHVPERAEVEDLLTGRHLNQVEYLLTRASLRIEPGVPPWGARGERAMEVIVEHCDKVFALWDGRAAQVAHGIEFAAKKGRPYVIETLGSCVGRYQLHLEALIS